MQFIWISTCFPITTPHHDNAHNYAPFTYSAWFEVFKVRTICSCRISGTWMWGLTRFLIHLFACPCGSMKRGHLLENLTITPFSTDSVSLGSPAICQRRMLTGSPRVEMRVAELLWGTWCSESFSCHSWTSFVRYFPWAKASEKVVSSAPGPFSSNTLHLIRPIKLYSWLVVKFFVLLVTRWDEGQAYKMF